MVSTPTKEEVRKILSKGHLSGTEAGLLVFRDAFEADAGRKAFLTKKDTRTILSSLKTQEDVREYNALLETYRLGALTVREGHAACLEAETKMLRILPAIYMHMLRASVDVAGKYQKPDFLSEAAYQSLVRVHGKLKESKADFLKTIRTYNTNVRALLRMVLAYQEVQELLSEHLQMQLTDALEQHLEQLKSTLNTYNLHTSPAILKGIFYGMKADIPKLEIDKLTPTPAMVKYLKTRMELSLGEEWWTWQRGQVSKQEQQAP